MLKRLPRHVRFGAFELDLDTGELSGSGPTVQLAEKPLRILITLVEHGGQLVTRETLQERLWPNDTIVDFEHGINTAMKVLRKALGDSADAPKYVETVPRRGYRLIVPVEWIDGAKEPKTLGAASPPSPPVRTRGMASKIVSHYQVLDIIGGGGMGVVYRAEDLKLGRLVALKFLSEELGDDTTALDRFHREARAVSMLDHPNICPIYEFGEHEGRPFLVMPLLHGQTLHDRLDSVARREALPLEELLGVGLDVSAGLQAAHEKGIIHRDIKPANVFLTDHGHAKILDFGVAKVAQTPVIPSASPEPVMEPFVGNGSDLTNPGSLLGTYPYMSPEQAERKELDARTDLFSFGVVLCEMATAPVAFQAGDSAAIVKAIAEGKPVPLKLANPEMLPELERIIQKALQKDPELRYQTAAEMHSDLSRLKRDSGGQTSSPPVSATGAASHRKLWARALIPSTILLCGVLAAGGFFYFRARHSVSRSRSAWIQLTDFSDGATQPALSPDGRMLAFIRGPETFVTPGQIYVKTLPDGQPVQLTHDNLPKMAPVFSPDGSRIAYTAVDSLEQWNTWVVPVPGGEPRMLLRNAGGLTWIAPNQVVFSEIKSGTHMGISTATESRTEERDVYVPVEMGGMAHRSWTSPNRKWVIVAEMGYDGWYPCRLVSFDGRSQSRTIGPKKARCTYAAWSQDGNTIYFSADAGDGYHIWQQTFPDGVPEQLTSGATHEEGIALSLDGHSLITSAGIRSDSVWIHDTRGDRQISEEGFAALPGLGYGGTCGHSAFSPDGKRLLYLLNAKNSQGSTSLNLWSADLDSGRSEPVLPNVSIGNFDLSPNGDQVAYNAQDSKGEWLIWLTQLDRRTSPNQLTSRQAYVPCFGAGAEVYFRIREESGQDFLHVQGPKDPRPRQVWPQPLPDVFGISPKGDIILNGSDPLVALSIMHGTSRPICQFCSAGWGLGGTYFYIRLREVGEMGGGTALAFKLPPGEELPPLPPSGVNSAKDVDPLKVAKRIDMRDVLEFNPGPSPDIYAYTRTTIQRNLFRIPLN
jgi:eukaryotic-like serine/threonine-protein kinase